MEHKILEVEIKAYCDNTSALRESLYSIGADYIETRDEQDIYFNHPSRDFGKTDEALRLRFINGKCKVTYKGPKVSSETKARIVRSIITGYSKADENTYIVWDKRSILLIG